MDDLAGKNAENAVSAVFRGDAKFRGGGKFRRGEFQRPHRAISEDDAVPANVAAGVAFGDEVIRGRIPRQEPEAELTVFIAWNGGGDDCAETYTLGWAVVGGIQLAHKFHLH